MRLYYATIRNFNSFLEEISNIELQKKLWLEPNDQFSSFVELYNEIDPENGSFFIRQLGLLNCDNYFLKELRILYNLLMEYKEPYEYFRYKSDLYILEDCKWQNICKQGEIVYKLWSMEIQTRLKFAFDICEDDLFDYFVEF
jgi:hypothetical protein